MQNKLQVYLEAITVVNHVGYPQALVVLLNSTSKLISETINLRNEIARQSNLTEASNIIKSVLDALKPFMNDGHNDNYEKQFYDIFNSCLTKIKSGKDADLIEVVSMLGPLLQASNQAQKEALASGALDRISPVSMKSASKKAMGAYKSDALSAEIAGASNVELIKMLFDGFYKFVNKAKSERKDGHLIDSSESIGRAIDILEIGLRGSLLPNTAKNEADLKKMLADKNLKSALELSVALDKTYNKAVQKLLHASFSKKKDESIKYIDEAIKIIDPIAKDWEQIVEASHNGTLMNNNAKNSASKSTKSATKRKA